jgi:hypothetical protein
MADSKNVPREQKVKCETCLKEIPRSEAKSREADEYVIWFCGLECYEEWRETEDRSNRDQPLGH